MFVFNVARFPIRVFKTFSGFHQKYSFRWSSDYIERCQLLQRLKFDDDLCKQTFKTADFIVFAGRKPLLNIKGEEHSILYNTFHDVRSYFADEEDLQLRSALLNVGKDQKCLFAVSLPDKPKSAIEELEIKSKGLFSNERSALFVLPTEQSNIVSQGVGILTWNHHFQFCPKCGKKLVRFVSGWQKKCSSCNRIQYPQTSPVVITLVYNETSNSCVLVRQRGHYKGMYTAVAGFLEIGETVEDATRREIAEEIGLEIKTQRYIKSQHWPGPLSSLMIGCLAVTDNTDIILDEHELEDAKWFSEEEVKQGLRNTIECKSFTAFAANENNKFMVPPKPAIAQELMLEWLNIPKNTGLH